MSQYLLQPVITNQLYQDTIDSAVIEFEKYFDIKLSQKICLIFLNSRQQFDDIIGRQTEPFETGYSTANYIFMMAQDVYEKESNKKFNLQKELLTLRHEVCHKYFQRVAWTTRPVWLNEGVAIYLSGQLTNYKKIDQFKNFLLFENTNFTNGQNVYDESGFVVEKLIAKFGKTKFMKFLTRFHQNKNVHQNFKQIYNLELNYNNINNL